MFGGVFSEQGFERIGMVVYTRMVAELGTILLTLRLSFAHLSYFLCCGIYDNVRSSIRHSPFYTFKASASIVGSRCFFRKRLIKKMYGTS